MAELHEEVGLEEMFFADEIAALMEKEEVETPHETKEENEDELNETLDNVGKVESRVKLGEIWQLGRHKIACGDSTIESNVRALLGDKFGDVGMVWSDPPYGINCVSNSNRMKELGYKQFDNDDTTETAKKAFFCLNKLAKVQIWWGANYFVDILSNSKSWIFWDKDHHGMDFGDGELAWTNTNNPIRCFRYAWSGAHRNSERGIKREHPNQKPIALCEWAFEKYGQSNDLIFDPFLGSAPSIIAAQKMQGDRTVYGFELSEDYCEVIIQRYENFTGDIAKLVGRLPN